MYCSLLGLDHSLKIAATHGVDCVLQAMNWKSYRDLEAWQAAMDLVVNIYNITSNFPPEEKFGLTSQIRRSAVSIPSNIAEGTARIGGKQLLLFLSYAQGSLAELETQLLIAQKTGLVEAKLLPTDNIKSCRSTLYALVYRIRHQSH